MASITSLGIGSGLDINSIVTQLVALEREPLKQMQTDASTLQTKVSSYGKIQSLFSAVQDASNKLSGSALWTQVSAKSADTTAMAVTATGAAATGSYAVSVQALATSQSVVSGARFANTTDLVGSGTLNVELGAWDTGRTAFTAKAGATPLAITVTATDTLGTLRDKINAAGAGVSASIVTDASGSRLAIRSSDTGLENGFRITAADDDGGNTDAAGLSRFAYDPTTGAAQMLHSQAGANALATINGIEVTSATNVLSGAVDGLTIQLGKVTTGPVDVSVSSDTDAINKAITDFAKAYSDLSTYLGDQTKYDAASKTGGPLQGDSTATGLQGRLRSVLNSPSGASASFPRLSDLGLELQRNGTLQVNQTKVTAALSNLKETKKAFSNYDTLDATNNGFAKRYALLATSILGADGAITTRTEGLRKQITNNTENQARLNDRVDLYQQRLVQQYSAMDANMSKLNALSSYVTQQLAGLTSSSSSK
ncbi:flagellar filament capping protein FliD [Methylibium sp.]|uniref:flagellar filament capping protein FliD n=1 Tax=Methylibium sp. TaxID=2067992 RepID=UPI003D099FD8